MIVGIFFLIATFIGAIILGEVIDTNKRILAGTEEKYNPENEFIQED